MKDSTLTNDTPEQPAAESKEAANPRKITIRDLDGVVADTRAAYQYFVEHDDVNLNLTGKERLRLIRSNVRNNGFIDKSYDLARDNPQFLAQQLPMQEWTSDHQRYELLRQWVVETAEANRIATDAFYQQSDVMFRHGLLFYGGLRVFARNKIQGAMTLFNMLKSYFENRAHKKGTKPTEKKLERDAKKLLKGKADGTMLIKNERPRMVEGKHEVIDNVHTETVSVEETVEKAG